MKPKQDLAELSDQYCKQCSLILEDYQEFEKDLGVGHLAKGFTALRMGWDDKNRAFTFPICDEDRKVIGIKRRFLSCNKVSVIGKKSGIFLSQNRYDPSLPVLLTKDEIECAAALHLGFQAIAPFRSNEEYLTLSGSEIVMMKWLQKNSIQDIVTFSEADAEQCKRTIKFAIDLAFEDLLLRIAFPPSPFNSFKELIAHKPSHEEISNLIDRATPITSFSFRLTEDGLCIETRATHTS